MMNVNSEASVANAQSGTQQTKESLPESSATLTSDKLILFQQQKADQHRENQRKFDERFPTPAEALASDAPLRVLMSLRDNPNLALATDDELEQLAMKLRMVAATPQTQESLRRKEAGDKAPKRVRKVDPKVAERIANAQFAD